MKKIFKDYEEKLMNGLNPINDLDNINQNGTQQIKIIEITLPSIVYGSDTSEPATATKLVYSDSTLYGNYVIVGCIYLNSSNNYMYNFNHIGQIVIREDGIYCRIDNSNAKSKTAWLELTKIS